MYQSGNEGSSAPHAPYCIRLAHLLSASLKRHHADIAQLRIPPPCNRVCFEGFGQIKALYFFATEIAHDGELQRCFYALGDDAHAQAVRDGDNRLHDATTRLVIDVLNETAVNLDANTVTVP